MFRKDKSVETRSKLEVAEGWQWKRRAPVNAHRASSQDGRHVLKLTAVIVRLCQYAGIH